MKSFNLFLIIFVVCLTIAGCTIDAPVTGEPEAKSGEILTTHAFGVPAGMTHWKSDTSLTPDDRQALIQHMPILYFTFEEPARLSADWREADRSVRALLASPPEALRDVPRYLVEQSAANSMLRGVLVEGEVTPEKQEALSFYVDLMVKNRNPEAKLTAPALARLEGYWDRAKVQQSAIVLAEAGAQYLEEEGACEGCTAKTDARGVDDDPALERAKERYFASSEAAVSALLMMAK